MSQTWGEAADEVIAKVHESLPIDASYEDASKAIRDAYPFGQRENWPYTAWLKARRRYLMKRFPRKFRQVMRQLRAQNLQVDTALEQTSLFNEDEI